ncbi:glycosyltransferase family A protein [Neobacillus sp. PS3-34]|uniref:glycosyltransferase family 2 protein n=1 Tax=Neobacillus sp. PS3-34 TaxID=3070678 RepID=UPI0027DF20D5|nr:glycosyltransferase family A protein [Neobacillus sp. PS3-34]WML49010.1 glycosyltransferase family A protein [Neobacillus sp. PS3-34]
MISVVACTNREWFLKNIISNFQKQTIRNKELLIILHSLKIDVLKVREVLEKTTLDYSLLHFSEEMTLGECLNKGGQLAKYDFIAKMDDDDYYGANYLSEAFDALTQTNAMMVGKASFYIYFKQQQELRLFNPNRENLWIKKNSSNQCSCLLSGATLSFKKELFNTVTFPSINQGEDTVFQKSCLENGIKILSLSKNDYAYFRYSFPHHHTSDATDHLLKSHSLFVSKTDSFENIVSKT